MTLKSNLTLEEMVAVDELMNDYGIIINLSKEELNTFVEGISSIALRSVGKKMQVSKPSMSAATGDFSSKQYELELGSDE